jgi:chromate reductase, NAD(P)H dehydrogenase (quinone)
MITRHVAALVGSLCKDSFNRRIALEIAALAPLSLNLEIVEIGQLPHYDMDDNGADPLRLKA